MSSFEFPDFYVEQQNRVERALDHWLPSIDRPPTLLHRAMHYSVFGGGKRLRGVLVLEAGRLGRELEPEALEMLASAMEMIHTYSLIHDDLPAMDDDDFRRGKPSNHRKFGEDVAILAGDALLTRSFEILGQGPELGLDPDRTLRILRRMGSRCGGQGLIGGQIRDLHLETTKGTEEDLNQIHRWKTGSLMALCLEIGGLASKADEPLIEALVSFGKAMGLAFQIRDDVLDETGDFQKLGKDIRSDEESDKLTYPRLLGVEKSERKARELIEQATDDLTSVTDCHDRLLELAELVVERDH